MDPFDGVERLQTGDFNWGWSIKESILELHRRLRTLEITNNNLLAAIAEEQSAIAVHAPKTHAAAAAATIERIVQE